MIRLFMAWLLCITLCVHAMPEVNPFDDDDVQLSFHAPTLDLQAEGVKAQRIIKAIAEATHQNILITDAMDQAVNVQLMDVDWQKALTLICQQVGYRVKQEHGVWIITSKKTDEALTLRVFHLHYIAANSLVEMIKQNPTWLGDRSFVTIDSASNALIAHASHESLNMIEKLVGDLDKPAQQVLIQARIINANQSFAKELGLAFAATQEHFSVSTGPEIVPGFGHVNIAVGRLPMDTKLDLMIAAAEKEHLTQVLAMPKILTANEQEAHIKQGKELAFEETSASGATSVKFKEAVLELRVKPHITPSHEIVLELSVKHDVPGKLGDNGQPTIDTQSIQTQVRLNDGETVVLGGIFSETSAKKHSKVPILHQLPLIGLLFQEQYDKEDQDELLVFVTPHLV